MSDSSNEVLIRVRSLNDTRKGFDEAAADAEMAGEEAGESFGSRFSSAMSSHLKTGLGNAFKNIGKGGGIFAAGSGLLAMASPIAAATAALGAFGVVAEQVLSKGGAGANALKHSWNGILSALRPAVNMVAEFGAKVLTDAAPAIETLARAGAGVVDSLLKPLDAFIKSASFGKLISQMAQFAGQLGSVLGPQLVKLIAVLMQLFVQLMPSGIQILNVLLPLIVLMATNLTPVIVAVAKAVAVTLQWLQASHLLLPVLAAIAIGILAIEAPVSAVVIAIAILITAGVELAKHWSQIWHGITSAVDAALGWLKAHWPLVAGILGGPVAIAAVLIATHLHTILNAFSSVWREITRLVADAWNAITSAVSAGASLAVRLVENLVNRQIALFQNLWHDLVSVVSAIWGAMTRGWDEIYSTVISIAGRIVSGAVGILATLPARAYDAVAGLNNLMFSAGAHIIESLASGIMSAIGDVTHAIGSVVGEITSHLPFSPAKKGPLSGSGSPDKAGQRIASMLASGMVSGLPQVTAASGRMAGAAGTGGHGYGGYGGQPLKLQVEWVGGNGGDHLLQWIRANVRIYGGGGPDSVQRALGRVT